MSQDHWLLTGLGLNLRPTTFVLDGASTAGAIPATALLRLLPEAQRPTRMLVVTTPEARKGHEAALEEEATAAGATVAWVTPAPDVADDASKLLDVVLGETDGARALTLDLTGGERMPSLALYAAAAFLSVLRDVPVRGAWYARLRDGTSTFIPQTPIFELPAWIAATAEFVRTGGTASLARLFDANEAPEAARQLRRFGFAYDAALPYEIGVWGAAALPHLGNKPTRRFAARVPFARRVLDRVLEEVNELAAPDSQTKTWKSTIPATDSEAERQIRLLRRYVERNQPDRALRLAREWLVSVHVEPGRAALGKADRQTAERRLSAVAHHPKAASLPAAVREVGVLWNAVTERRNEVAHCGMKPSLIEPNAVDGLLPTLPGRLMAYRRPEDRVPIRVRGQGRVLVTPIGLSPGVLRSAVHHSRPDRLVVIGSGQSLAAVDDAIARSEFAGDVLTDVLRWEVTDPHAGYADVDATLRALTSTGSKRPGVAGSLLDWLADAAEVVVNLTGGTTLLGYAALEVAAVARRLDRPVRRIALLDRRSLDAQRADPWAISDVHDLNRQDEAGD